MESDLSLKSSPKLIMWIEVKGHKGAYVVWIFVVDALFSFVQYLNWIIHRFWFCCLLQKSMSSSKYQAVYQSAVYQLWVRQIYNHIPSRTPLPLAGKCYFSAPPYACHLVPPTPDGEILIFSLMPLWCFDHRFYKVSCCFNFFCKFKKPFAWQDKKV